MVQSARVQEIVKGDDVTMKHQIMGDVAYDAEASRAPVDLQTGDTAKAFYPLQDSTTQDLVGYDCTPVGVLPTSEVTVDIPGVIPEVPNISPERGTKTFQSGLGRTVRIEITRIDTKKETYYLINEVDIFERGFPSAQNDTSGGKIPVTPPLNLT